MELRVKPVESTEEQRVATDLMAGEHARDLPEFRRWLEQAGQRYPNFRREHTRIACVRDEIAAAMRLVTDTIRIGEARLKMGGIGAMAIPKRHQRKGILTQLVRDALHYMSEHNYHVAVVFGSPDFYQQFGFAPAFGEYSIRVNTIEALTFGCPYRMREATPGEIPLLQRLHNDSDGPIACSVVRSAAHFKSKWELWRRWWVLTDDNGKLIAYFYARPFAGFLNIDEIGFAETRLCSAVVGAAAHAASDLSLGQIRFCVPPAHAFARFMLQFQSTHECRIDRDSAGMMTIVNCDETLESMIPEWEARLAASLAREFRTEITLVANGSQRRIRATRGVIDIANFGGSNKFGITPRDLAQLVAGYRYPEDCLEERRTLLTAESRTLFATLFPKRTPYIWNFDRF